MFLSKRKFCRRFFHLELRIRRPIIRLSLYLSRRIIKLTGPRLRRHHLRFGLAALCEINASNSDDFTDSLVQVWSKALELPLNLLEKGV